MRKEVKERQYTFPYQTAATCAFRDWETLGSEDTSSSSRDSTADNDFVGGNSLCTFVSHEMEPVLCFARLLRQ